MEPYSPARTHRENMLDQDWLELVRDWDKYFVTPAPTGYDTSSVTRGRSNEQIQTAGRQRNN